MTDPIPRRLLNIKELARYTGLSVHTLYAMVSQRRIPYVKMGSRTMFILEDIDRHIAFCTVKARRSFSAVTP